MVDLIPVLIFFAVIIYQGWLAYDQRKSYEARISNLLDRVMSKDYPMYVQAEVAKKQVELPPEPYEERGIPI